MTHDPPNITLDRNNNLWIGSYLGALKFDGSNFSSYTTANGLPDNSVRIFVDKQNDVWFLTNVGLCVLRNGTTALETVTTTPTLPLYPNPAQNTLNFPEIQGKTTVEIYDTQGKLHISQSLSQNTMDISSLCAGIYIVKTQNEKGRFVNKIVKR
jgi:ligand-binding sensor domain-containing protein